MISPLNNDVQVLWPSGGQWPLVIPDSIPGPVMVWEICDNLNVWEVFKHRPMTNPLISQLSFFEDIIDESVFLPINITFLWNFPRCVNNEKHGLCTFSTSRDIFSKNLVVSKQKSDKLLQCWFKSAVKRLCSAIAMLSLGGNLFSALQCWIAVFRSKVQGRLKQFHVYIFYISAA